MNWTNSFHYFLKNLLIIDTNKTKSKTIVMDKEIAPTPILSNNLYLETILILSKIPLHSDNL